MDILETPIPQDFAVKVSQVLSKIQPEAIEASDSKPKLLEFFGNFTRF